MQATIQPPVMSAPSPAASSSPPQSPAEADKDGAARFAEVLRGKQAGPRKEPVTAHKQAAPANDKEPSESATIGVDASMLPPDLAAALAQIGQGQPGVPRGRDAALRGTADPASADAGLADLAPAADPRDATALGTAALGADSLSARLALLGAPAMMPGQPGTIDGKSVLPADMAPAGARTLRADGVLARTATPGDATDALTSARFEALVARAATGKGGAETGVATADMVAPRNDLPNWAALAVPADAGAVRPGAGAPHVATVDAPVGSPRFTDETAQHVTWMAKNGIGEAEIRIKPAELGPISVRIEVNQNEAVINFAVTQPETRAAVQDSLHRLQEMLAESGISLGEANVGGQGFTQQSGDGGNGIGTRNRVTFGAGNGGADGGDAPGAAPRLRAAEARGLVDTFA